MKDAIRDIDFSRAHKDKVLVTTCEDGSCSLWETDTGNCLTTLELPAGVLYLAACCKHLQKLASLVFLKD